MWEIRIQNEVFRFTTEEDARAAWRLAMAAEMYTLGTACYPEKAAEVQNKGD